jgi:hypothetical protein
MKRTIVLLIAGLLLLLGLTGVLWPSGLRGVARWTFSPTGLYTGAGVRVLVGALLIVAAGATAMPKTVRVIGAIIFVAGTLTALMSVETAQRMAAWFFDNGEDRVRMIACLPLAVGLFLGGVTLFNNRSALSR